MAGRTIPPAATVAPGQFVASALWNTQITNGTYSFTFNPPVFKGQSTTAQSIANGGTYTTLTLTAAVTDTEGGWVSGSPTIYTVQTPGRYSILASAGCAGASGTDTTPRGVSILINGTNARAIVQASGGSTWIGQCAMETYLSAGTTVAMGLMQQSGAAQNTSVGSAAQYPTLDIVWLGAS
jgi:hypothetical protein